MHPNLLYVLPECGGCNKARRSLNNKGISYTEIVIDNPIVELGVKQLFKGKIYAPFLLKPEEGLFVFSGKESEILTRVVI